MEMQDREHEIAVVGMSCRFPGAGDPLQFWKNLCAGVESVSFLSEDELLAAGVSASALRDPSYVRVHGVLADAWAFDAPFFGVSQREAQLMDPQQRVFLECAWSALEDAGCDPARFAGAVGVFAGSGGSDHLWRVLAHPDLAAAVGATAVIANKPDFLTTRVSYKLGLRGPSVAVQTACSTSLVAIHLACQSLLNRECDLALAGGVTLAPDPTGYRYQEGGIHSPDGHCRAFDARAAGTVSGSGAGVVALKRMADALRDGDSVRAVVKGSAVNNDGAAKIGFTAPSVPGQAEAITEALAVAGVDPRTVTFVETHGTGTPLGDPIEAAALLAAYGADGPRPPCALGAVKSNFGHLDTAAGVAGFIKAVLALEHRMLPPTLHFETPNPETGLEGSPFYVNTVLRPWESGGSPRRAGVSSFGIGGTNAHVVLEEAPELPAAEDGDAAELLVLSAKCAAALERTRANLARHLAEHPEVSLAAVARTLREGRAAHPHRWAAVARGVDGARQALAGTAARPPIVRRAAEQPPVAFLFPGGGTQYAGMARELYAREPVFRAEIDACAGAVAPELGLDLRMLLFPAEGGEAAAREHLEQIPYALPALFAVEYALAQLWMEWGVRPQAMLGHSMGEYAAAALAGVFSRDGAIRLVAARARLMQSAPAGAMLAVPLPEGELRSRLPAGVALAAVNSAAHCVVSGATAEVGEVEARLAETGVVARRLHVSVASHSPAMDGILEAFAAEVRRARPAAPRIPFLSNVTGDWITAGQATDPDYWVRHLRQTVRFADGIARLLQDPERVLLEVGPGEALGTFARRDAGGGRVIVKSLPPADQPDAADLTVLEAAGALWTAGVELDWAALGGGAPRRRIPLPTYPFERTEHRLPPASPAPPSAAPQPAPAAVAAAVSAPPSAACGPSGGAGVPLAGPPDPAPEPRSEPVGTETLAPPARLPRIAARVAEIFARLLGAAPAELDPSRTFLELGADSLLLMQASRTVESTFGVRVPFRMMLEGVPTPGELAAYLDRELPPDPEPPTAAPASTAAVEAPVAAPVPAGDAPALQTIFAQQLAALQAVIGQQMEILRGAAATSSAVLPPSAGNGRYADPPAAPGPSSALPPPAPRFAPDPPRAPAAASTPAPGAAEAPASHGPHRPIRQTLGQGGGYTARQARHLEELVRGYNARTRRSKEYAARHRPRLSDNRAALGFRMATKELLYPIVGERSQGSRIWDIDGNEYVDFTCGFGVHFFGHRPPFVVDAVEEQLGRGFHLGPQSDLVGPAAELLCELTGVERATFCNTGSEATMTAVRIARAATGRDRIVLFAGSYHGCYDGVLARSGIGRNGEPRTLPVALGTPQRTVDDVVVLPYGAPESLGWLRAHAAEIAAVLVEPAPSNDPELHPREFLHELRALTAGAGTVLVFDEIITGLRLGVRGAQELYGVDADLVTYGKVIGGGFPVGVVAGRARLMDAIDGGQWSFGDDSFPAADQTYFAGTFCKHPVAMAAVCAVLRHLQERGPALYHELNARTARLVAALREVIAREGAPVRILHCASRFSFRVDPREPWADLLFYHLLQRGMYIWEGRGCFLSTAHTDDDCDLLVDAFRDSLRALREGGFLPEQSGRAAPVSAAVAETAPVPSGLKLFPAPDPADAPPRSFPLTPAQRQIWVHAQLGGDAALAYQEQLVFAVRGGLDPAALQAALHDVMLHHEALRTVFDPSGEAQHVLPSLPAEVRVEAPLAPGDPEALERALGAAAREAFDLAAGPLLRVHLHPRGAAHVVQVVFHHLAADGLAVPLLLRDLEAACAARREGRAPALSPAMQFSEYAALLDAEAQAHAGREAEWLERFQGAVPLALPADRPRPRVPAHAGAQTALTLGAPLAAALKELGRREGLTLHMTLLAGLLATLHRLGGQDDVVVGVPSAGRPFPGSGTLVGNCVDVLPVRSRIGGVTTVRAFLKQVRGWLLDAYEHEAFSLARLAERLEVPRGPGVPPLVSVVLNLEPGAAGEPAAAPRFAGLEMEGVKSPARFTKFDLDLDAVEHSGGIDLGCTFNTGLFEPATARRMLGGMERVLEQLAAVADVPLRALELMDGAERRQVLETWNRTAAREPGDVCIHHLFEAQAERTPDADAVVCEDETLTYRELNARANRLAHHLRRLGVGPEARVGVCMERAPELIVSLLAVLKAGGAYVPIDPAYPPERIAWMAGDAGAGVLLAQERLRPLLAAAGARVLSVDAERPALAAGSARNPVGGASPRGLAYVIYTSGSSGRPKGVAVEHRSLANFALHAAREFGVGPADRVLQFSSISFDAAAEEIFATLFSGASLVLRTEGMLASPPAFWEACGRWGVTVVDLPTALWHGLALELDPPPFPAALRLVVFGGERALPGPLRAWRAAAGERVRLLNTYGPTETTVAVTAWDAAEGADAVETVPIGRPGANVRAYVLDGAARPVPPRVPGELYAGGVQVARGYLGRPALTAERFVPDPFGGEPGARLYRTGDQVRWRDTAEDPRGEERTPAPPHPRTAVLEYLGRLDQQVKLRGFRIEPGEVESALSSHPAVREVRVVAREDEPGELRLVAYVVGEADGDELRAHLGRSLPEHMVPAAFVALESLPLTPAGKLDRAALPAPDLAGDADRRGAPRTPAEAVLAGIWAEVLRVERVGVHDSFFALGGHSLLATRVVSRVRDVFGVELTVRALFEMLTVAELAARVEALRRTGAPVPPPVVPVERGRPLPLSFAQERLWFLDRLQPGSAVYNLPAALRLAGALDAAALERALGEVVRRHEALRTVFVDGGAGPVQVIVPFAGFILPVEDLSALGESEREAEVRRRATEWPARPFALAAGPLFRAGLLRLAEADHVLLLGMHHVVSDGWSMGVLFRELAALYGAFAEGRASPLPGLPLQYADYAVWQREQLGGPALERELAYWRERLAGAPALLELPTDHPRPAVQTYRGATETFGFSAALPERLRALSRREGATLYMVALAAFQVLLAKYSGSDDVVVGSPIAGRTRGEVEELIGFFVNTLVLRTDLSGDPSFHEVLRRVREATLGAWEHQEVPFERLVEELRPERSLSHPPLFQVLFDLQEAGGPGAGLPGLEVRSVGMEGAPAKWDLTLVLTAGDDALSAGLTWAADLFERPTALRMMEHLGRILEQVVDDPRVRLSELTLLSPAERRQVLEEWNRTEAEYPPDACIHLLFERQAEQTPGAVAVVFEDASLTYRELNERANRLAHFLLRRGVGPEVCVGLCLERSPELVVSLLAVLKAGGAYVPLDPGYPAERLAFMLADSGVRVVLTQERLRAVLPDDTGAEVVRVDSAWDQIAAESAENPESGAAADSLAYVIYTSGSTGTPKGTLVEHRNVARLFTATNAWFGFGAHDVWTLFHSCAFDFSVWETWGALLHGGRLVVVPLEVSRDPEAFHALVRREGVTVLNQTPSAFRQLARVDGERGGELALRLVIFGGEALEPATLREWVERRGVESPRLVNMYGITETTVHVTYRPLTPQDVFEGARSPIGRRIPDLRLYVLDPARQPLPVGVPGELYVGGAGVARGYLDRPELTAARFVADPFGGGRLYRTGDRVRWLDDGTLEYLDRLDQQVKIRGFRVEPGEIEAVLRRHAGVADCAVVAREDAPGEKRLVAYLVGDADADALRAHLRGSVPEHMVPAAFVSLARLPLTPNGKLDRGALPAPDFAAAEDRYAAPRTPAEEVLAGAWAEVLGLERVGVRDNFFELGGHSLLATRLVSRIRQLLGVELPLRALFEGPTVAEAAERVEALRRADLPQLPPILPVGRDRPLPLSFAQERLWFLDRLEPGSALYNVLLATRLAGALDTAALERGLGEIVRRHEALRTTFTDLDGAAAQVIAPFSGFTLTVEDLSGVDGPARDEAARSRAVEEASRPFDLAAGPLFRATLLRLGGEEHVLLLTLHHIVSDGWSLEVLLRELSALYAAFTGGGEPPLPDLPVQYADYAVWQREQFGGPALEGELAWWRERLAGAPALLELPTDRPRPPVQSYRGAQETFALAAGLAERLRGLGRGEGATPFMVLLGAFQLLLARYSGSDDVVVGSPVAGRARAETEGLIGFFVNTLVLRTDLSGDPTFRELLRRVRETTLGAFEHQQVPFEKLVAELQPERSLGHAPLFQALFTLQTAGRAEGGAPGLRMEGFAAEPDTTKYALSLHLAVDAHGVCGALAWATDLFDRATIQRMVAHLGRVLEQVAADPGLPLSRLELLGDDERRLVLEEWNQTESVHPSAVPVHRLFEVTVEEAPGAPAVVCDDERLSRRELNERANRLAHRLVRLGVGPDVPVALCLERGVEMVVALLGVLKAGGAWVALDPALPAARLCYMLRDSGAAALVTRRALARSFSRTQAGALPVVHLDDADALAHEPTDNPEVGVHAEHLAYVVYTSGSTGRPKGVAVEHRQLAGYLCGLRERLGLAPGAACATVSTLGADLGHTAVFPPLAWGGALHVISEERIFEGDALAEYFDVHDIDLLKITPSHLAALQGGDPRRVLPRRWLVLGGESSPLGWADELVRAAGECAVFNHYGPTETTVGALAFHATPGRPSTPSSTLVLGRPLPGCRVYVADSRLRPVPPGVAGELLIGGAGLARGYLRRAALTAERFVPDPFSGHPGARLYRTGDRCRRLPDGNVEFLGRLDQQVKVRGFRVEPGEIELALSRHARVERCAVVVREDAPGEKRIVAYVVGRADAGELRAHLGRRLPEYMVPGAFVFVDELPLTPNGKLDRRALPAPGHDAAEERYVAPRTQAEAVLAEIWSALLRRERVGVEENFFALGGDSILCIQAVSRARRAGVAITPRQMFEHQTIAALAAAVERGGAPAGVRAEQGRVAGRVALTPVQRRHFEAGFAAPWHHNQAVLLAVDADVGDTALETALAAVLEHHDALRLRFRRTDQGWEQWHAADVGIALERIDLSGLSSEEQDRAQAELADARQASLELEPGPLGRAVRFDRGEEGWVLLLVLHHLVVDGVSWRILREDLERACVQAAAGEPVDLGAKSTSFRQWAEALEGYAAGDALRAEAAWWQAQGAEGVAPLPVDGTGERTEAAARAVSVALDPDETRALLQEVPAAYRTQINDVLLCALAEAAGAWTGSPRVRLALEGHGREEEIAAGIDLTRTMGWFTSVYPVVLDLAGAAGPGERLKRVKEQLRAIPGRGIGYGVLRWLSPDAEVRRALGAQADPELSFNYLGQFDGGEPAETRVRFAGGPHGRESAAENPRRYLLEVSGAITGGALQLGFVYGEGTHRRETVERLADAYLQALRGLIAHCRAADAGGCTPSDFPLAELTQGELDAVAADRRVEDLYPLSPLQEGLLFHALRDEGPQAYQVQVAQRLEGRLDVALLRRAWAEVAARHPVLRSSFAWQGLPRPLQRVESSVQIPWVEEDWSGLPPAEQEAALARYLDQDRAHGFRLDAAPLLRCALFRTGPEAYWLVTSRHHLLLDGWASARVMGEVFALYQAWSTGRAPGLARARPYRDYIAWLRRQDQAAAERYWRGVLAGFASPTAVGADRPAAPGATPRYARRSLLLPAERTRRVEAAARRCRVTLNTFVQGAWALLLSRYAGDPDVVFGNTVSGRPAELEGVEEMVGVFINTLPVRVRVHGGERLGPWLAELQRAQARAREYEHAPLAQVQGWSEVPRGTPLFESLFVFESFPAENYAAEPGRGPGAGAEAEGRLRLTGSRAVEWTTYPLTLAVATGRRLLLDLSYDGTRFEAATAARMLVQLGRVLERMAARPGAPLAQLELIGPRERRRVLEEWNRTGRPYPRAAVLHELFAAQAARSPDALALAWGGERMTYRELDARADRLARHLAALNVGPEVRVGLLLERGPEQVVAVLAVLKAGGCCVPVDTSYPPERIALMLEDSEARVLLTRSTLPAGLPADGLRVVRLDRDEVPDPGASGPPASGAAPGNLAYVFYTSGSTGRPKGVMMPHAQVVQHAWCLPACMPLEAGDRVAQASNASFDAAVFETWGALLHGAALVGLDREVLLSALWLGRALREQGITHLYQTAALFNQHVRERADVYAGLRQLVFGAEVVETESVRRMLREGRPGRVLHEYGPTEATVWCTLEEVQAVAEDAATVPIGRPVPNARACVLGPAGEPLPAGVPGELYVGGPGVVRGYLGRPGLTAERFVPDPFSPEPGARLYRTGDRVRWRADGKLEFMGRFDDQVKVRGFRVEPAEIEAALAVLPGVHGARVILREDAPGDRRLVAYVAGDADGEAMRAELRRTLPEHMVPAAFVSLERLPLTPNGKLDRRALPAPEPAAAQARYQPPRTPVEEALAAIWTQVLSVERVGADDDFFALGGHSLLVMRLTARVQTAFGMELSIRSVFSASTLEAMAAEIERRIYADIAAMPEAEAERLAELNPVPGE